MTDAQCAEVLEHVEDYLERQEPDYDPSTKWFGGNWRTGRSSLHTGRIQDKAAEVLPAWVIRAALRHYDSVDAST